MINEVIFEVANDNNNNNNNNKKDCLFLDILI
jgi:hypothetical protein